MKRGKQSNVVNPFAFRGNFDENCLEISKDSLEALTYVWRSKRLPKILCDSSFKEPSQKMEMGRNGISRRICENSKKLSRNFDC